MKKFIKFYNELMSYMGLICLLGFILSVFVQVFSRTFLPTAPSWTEEAARYLFIYMVAFGCSVAVHTKEFVGVDLLVSSFPKSVNDIITKLIHIGLMAFCAFILTQSVFSFAILKYRMVSTAMQIPMQYVYFSMILLYGLLVLSYILELILMFIDKEEN